MFILQLECSNNIKMYIIFFNCYKIWEHTEEIVKLQQKHFKSIIFKY